MNRKRVIALAVLSALFYALISVCVKWIGGTLPSMEIVFFRAFVMLVLFAGPRMLKRQRVCNKHKALLILRGVSGALRASTQYAATCSTTAFSQFWFLWFSWDSTDLFGPV